MNWNPRQTTSPQEAIFEAHRLFDEALRVALTTQQPALRRQAEETLKKNLFQPSWLFSSELLAENHPWSQSALLVSDAFESVTNGMEAPDLLDQLVEMSDDNLLSPWKHLALALHFFYKDLDEAAAAHLERIAADTPAAKLGLVIRTLIDRSTARLSPSLAALAAKVSTPDAHLVSLVQDISQTLEDGDEASFWPALAEWLEKIGPLDPQRAQATVLWAWNQLEWREFDEEPLLNLSTALWGPSEAYRLAALGCRLWDSQGSALLWLRACLEGLRAGTPAGDLEELTQWIPAFREAADNSDTSTTAWRRDWDSLCHKWNSEDPNQRATSWLFSREPNTAHRSERETPKTPVGVQLDLFSW